MNTLYRLGVAAAVSGMLLAASPASAAGLGLAFGLGVHGNEQRNDNGNHFGQAMSLNAKMNMYDFRHSGSGSVKTNAEVKAKIEQKMTTRLTEMMKRSINAVVLMAKKVCKASADQSTVAACIEKARVDLKASVSVMIDAAFAS